MIKDPICGMELKEGKEHSRLAFKGEEAILDLRLLLEKKIKEG